jgi:hypothetical protein
LLAGRPFGSCNQDYYCSRNGRCIPDGTCESDADCGTKFFCTDGLCDRDMHCVTTDDCSSFEFCSHAGECAPSDTCVDDFDCGDGRCKDDLCMPAGRCLTSTDCLAPQSCSVTGTIVEGTNVTLDFCLNPGQCRTASDCPPGHTCSGGACVAGGIICTANKTDATDASCPVGNDCCPVNMRCSAATPTRSCISMGQCVTDADCLAGSFACVHYRCAPLVPCTSGSCGTGEKCSGLGGCVPDNKCAVTTDCLGGEVCSPTFQCVEGGNCGHDNYQATFVKPNMLIVLDRSGSMNGCVTGTQSRWAQAVGAVQAVLGANGDKIRFGLSTYPAKCSGAQPCTGICDSGSANTCNNNCGGGNNCQAGGVDVAVSDNTSAITTSLAANFPGGYTPTSGTLNAVLGNRQGFGLPVAGETLPRDNYVLLVTDGEANCPTSGAATRVNTALKNLVALVPSIKTYVVGLAFGTISTNLNCHAVNGKTSRCPATVTASNCGSYKTAACYYPASNVSDLTAAFDAIVSSVAGCRYALDQRPPDVNSLYVYLVMKSDGSKVRLTNDRWTYDDVYKRVEVLGTACTQVENRQADIEVIYGCPPAGS